MVKTEPRVWQISKINRTNSKGVVVFTCTQDIANTHSIKADYDEDGNVVAWWADWKDSDVAPTSAYEEPSSTVTATITCSAKQQIKVGSTKTFTITYYDDDGEELPNHVVGEWSVQINGEDISEDLIQVMNVESDHKYKIRFLGDDSYIGTILTIQNKLRGVNASLDIEVAAL